MDTTPLPVIATIAVIAILVWIALEVRHLRKGGGSHYNFNQQIATVSEIQETPEGIRIKGKIDPKSVYDQTRANVDKIEKEL